MLFRFTREIVCGGQKKKIELAIDTCYLEQSIRPADHRRARYELLQTRGGALEGRLTVPISDP